MGRPSRTWCVAVTLAALACFVRAPQLTLSAQTSGEKESFAAYAYNMGSGPSAQGMVIIAVERWSTPSERTELITAFKDGGPDALLKRLWNMQVTGYMRLPTTIRYDLRYAHQEPNPEGGRRIFLATDRRISTQEQLNNPKTMDYPFTLIELHLDRNNRGEGKLSLATKITVSKDGDHVELENWGTQPVTLSNVEKQ
jgi:hypothetical protein